MKWILGSFVIYTLARGSFASYVDLANSPNPSIAEDAKKALDNEQWWQKMLKGTMLEPSDAVKRIDRALGIDFNGW